MKRVLAVDPGDARIGLALSDPLGMIARPLKVFLHSSRSEDAQRIVNEAQEHEAELILLGLPLDHEGRVGFQARKTIRLAEALREITAIEIQTWDESGTTKRALESAGDDEMLDARAAAYMLQDFLDASQ